MGKYKLLKTIGTGKGCSINLAQCRETGEVVAIKTFNKRDLAEEDVSKSVITEVTIANALIQLKKRHKNVVEFKGWCETENHILIVMEYLQGGELFDKIVNAKNGCFDEKTSRMYIQQLVSGLEFCHANGIIHRDLKPENLLLDKEENLKIADFGLSYLMSDGPTTSIEAKKESNKLLETICGTPFFLAPEVLTGKKYDGKKADVWSCGIVLYVMLVGNHPFADENLGRLCNKISNLDYDIPDTVPRGARNLIKRILVTDPDLRPTLAEIEEDDWFNGEEDDLESCGTPKTPLSPTQSRNFDQFI